MAFNTSLFLLITFFFFITSISSSHAYTFQVGGKDGWTLHPSESYNNWAGRLRFSVNDTLHFKYDGSSDSVLVVNKSDYDGCNGNNPIMKLEGGDSTFKFDRSGPFYFITGNKSNCDQGQKLIVVVLAVRNQSPPPSVATPPSPTTISPSPAVSPVFPPSESPVSTPPAPSPGGGAAPAPSTSGGADAPAPGTSGGGGAPAPGTTGGEGAPTPGTTGGGDVPAPGTGTSGGSASPPGGGGDNNPSADTTTPPSAAAPPLSGGIIGLGVTVIFALWEFY